MGLTIVEATVSGPTGKTSQVRFLVDSGATYSLLPREVWQRIGLKPMRKAEFVLADASRIERKVSECQIALAGVQGHSPVILGEKGDEPLLGVVTLENLGLMLDPFKRELRAMQMRLG